MIYVFFVVCIHTYLYSNTVFAPGSAVRRVCVCVRVSPGRCSVCPRPSPTAHTSGWMCSPPGWSAASGRPASGDKTSAET